MGLMYLQGAEFVKMILGGLCLLMHLSAVNCKAVFLAVQTKNAQSTELSFLEQR